MYPIRTYPKASTASDAFFRIKFNLILLGNGFWIMAPPALKIASLEENCSSYSWPVMYRKSLDIE
jgi:hypothetical protein